MKAFKLGGYGEVGTSGITMWSQPFPMLDKEGNKTGTDILLLDTEGLG